MIDWIIWVAAGLGLLIAEMLLPGVFIARNVMRSTSGSEPASAARSSITSFSMRVESTSSTTRKLAMIRGTSLAS